jgi:hypothetical protein
MKPQRHLAEGGRGKAALEMGVRGIGWRGHAESPRFSPAHPGRNVEKRPASPSATGTPKTLLSSQPLSIYLFIYYSSSASQLLILHLDLSCVSMQHGLEKGKQLLSQRWKSEQSQARFSVFLTSTELRRCDQSPTRWAGSLGPATLPALFSKVQSYLPYKSQNPHSCPAWTGPFMSMLCPCLVRNLNKIVQAVAFSGWGHTRKMDFSIWTKER